MIKANDNNVTAANRLAWVRHNAPNIRWIHASFTGIYVLFAAFFLIAPIVFINYEIIFQSGLLGFLIGIAFLMLSCVMVGKEICLARGQFFILHRHLIAIIFCAVAAAIFTFFYIWNVANILSMCSQFDANMSATMASQTEIRISYTTPFHGILRRQSLRLRYDAEEKRLIRSQSGAPEIPESLKTESFRYETRRMQYKETYRRLLQTLKTIEEVERMGMEASIADEQEMQFYMLQNEIVMLMEEQSRRYEEMSSYAIKSVVPLHTTSIEEDEQFQEDRAAKICRNEQGFGIFLLVILILAEILYILTIAVYAWIKSWTNCICLSLSIA